MYNRKILTNATLDTLVDFGESPVARHTSVAFYSSDAWSTLALSCLGMTSVRQASQSIAVALIGTTGFVRPKSCGFTIGTTAVIRVFASR